MKPDFQIEISIQNGLNISILSQKMFYSYSLGL